MSTVYALPCPPAACSVAREKVVADAMRPVAAEMLLVDPAELIYLCQAEKHANLDDLVQAAVEMTFRPETVRYGGAAELELQWNCHPRIVLDMEFEHREVLILFRLRISAGGPGVDICHVHLHDFTGPPAAVTQLIAARLEEARLPSRQRA